MNHCKLCNHPHATLHSISLVDMDEESINEGQHEADVDLHLCAECVAPVADAIQEFVQRLKLSQESEAATF